MSSEGRVAKLYAEVGFEVSDSEAEKVKQVFNAIKDKIDEAIEKTAQFASDLVKLSKGTGLSTTLLQNFHKMGIEAGITADEVDGLLASTNELANKSYWGFTNQLSMWGIYLSRGENAATALIKVLRGMNGQSYNRQLEIAREAGIDITAALMMLDRLKENGFKIEDAFGLDKKTVDEMHQVNIEFNKLDYSWEMFYNRLVGTQSDTILRTTKGISGFVQRIQDAIVGISSTTPMRGLLGTALTLMPLVNYALNYADKVMKGLDTTFRIIGNVWGVAKWGIFLGILLKILGAFNLIKKINFIGTLQEQFDKFIKGSGGLGKEIVNKMNSIIEGSLKFIEENFPEFGEKSGLTQFLKDSKDGKIFDALGKWIDYLIGKIVAIWNGIFPKIKSYAKTIFDYGKSILNASLNWLIDKANELIETLIDETLLLLMDVFEALGMGNAQQAIYKKYMERKGGTLEYVEGTGFLGFGKDQRWVFHGGETSRSKVGSYDSYVDKANDEFMKKHPEFANAMGYGKNVDLSGGTDEDAAEALNSLIASQTGSLDEGLQRLIDQGQVNVNDVIVPNTGYVPNQQGNTNTVNVYNTNAFNYDNVRDPSILAERTAVNLADPNTWRKQNNEFNQFFAGRNSNGFAP